MAPQLELEGGLQRGDPGCVNPVLAAGLGGYKQPGAVGTGAAQG